MSPDDTRCENQVQDCSVGAYVVSFSDTNEMNKFWQMVLEKEKGRKTVVNQEENDSRLPQNVTAETSRENTTSADTDVAIKAHDLKGKRKANSEENRDIEKKRRVVWTPKMHQSFLQAIQYLGYESKTFSPFLFSPESSFYFFFVLNYVVDINETFFGLC